jgi:hypothetical protein
MVSSTKMKPTQTAVVLSAANAATIKIAFPTVIAALLTVTLGVIAKLLPARTMCKTDSRLTRTAVVPHAIVALPAALALMAPTVSAAFVLKDSALQLATTLRQIKASLTLIAVVLAPSARLILFVTPPAIVSAVFVPRDPARLLALTADKIKTKQTLIAVVALAILAKKPRSA